MLSLQPGIKILIAVFTLAACNKAPQRPVGGKPGPNSSNTTPAINNVPTPSGNSNTNPEPSPKPAAVTQTQPTITNIAVKNDKGESPKKGDALKITLSLKNEGSTAGEVNITPTLSCERYEDFSKIPLPSSKVMLNGNANQDVTIDVPVFLEHSGNQKRFALGRGDYKFNVTVEAGKKSAEKSADFTIDKGPGVFALVLADKRYFDVGDAKGQDPAKWVIETMTRKSSVFYPGSNSKKMYPGGFDEIMGIKHIVKVVDQLDSTDKEGVDVFDPPEALAAQWLGMSSKWDHGSGPGTNKHGYDYFIALDKDPFGGVTFGAAQVSGAGIAGDFSKERMQIVLVHESGHVFGSPHCDPVQGYVMCSGEKNEAYEKDREFVWYEDSIKAMRNIFGD